MVDICLQSTFHCNYINNYITTHPDKKHLKHYSRPRPTIHCIPYTRSFNTIIHVETFKGKGVICWVVANVVRHNVLAVVYTRTNYVYPCTTIDVRYYKPISRFICMHRYVCILLYAGTKCFVLITPYTTYGLGTTTYVQARLYGRMYVTSRRTWCSLNLHSSSPVTIHQHREVDLCKSDKNRIVCIIHINKIFLMMLLLYFSLFCVKL